ncbi:GIY-YIG nuclease family protein [Propionivibrio dicarboxylicus]|uniref:Putative endonuclease n=1 Tax=Propionivibrio dicarboxylicus TaxID=83767 RepID=A0A1G8CTL6_9RHOO|nr:GIY-YIG nuclease family protein [Propionivibrio dicarboxylicus]SDH48529.1 putative endonuclease [Propionivibrio dicarboxylicus]
MSTAVRPWFVYLIECRGGSIYTGISTDVEARYQAHLSGKGARYTRMHPPQRLLAVIPCSDRSTALAAECRIKALPPAEKRTLASEHPYLSRTDPAATARDSRA